MEQPRPEVQGQSINPTVPVDSVHVSPSVGPVVDTISPQACSTCGTVPAANEGTATPPACVYVIGHVEPLFPLLSIEKEARQVTARAGASKDTDREAMAKLLHDPGNKYLVRQLCWVLSVSGVETYILVPRDGDYQPLVDAYRAEPNPGGLELAIGIRGPIAPPTMCNGLQVPILIFDQFYAFDRESLLKAIPKPKEAEPKKFMLAVGEMFDRIMQPDNAGATDCDRAKNYLAVRYDRIYSVAAEQFGMNASFTSIDCFPSPLSGTRKIVDVVFSFEDRATGVKTKYFTRVDVTECFPFLVTKMSPYYDRQNH
jgi:PatG C-terminal